MIARRSTVLALCVSLAVVLSACNWIQFRYGSAQTGFNNTETAISVSNVSSLQLKFTAATGSNIANGSPVIANGVVYLGSEDKKLYAFDAAGNNTNCSGTPTTCAPLWTALTAGLVDSTPAVLNGIVYVTSANLLYAFDAAGNTNCSGSPKTCAPLWTATIGSGVSTSPTVTNGVVYVGSQYPDDQLYAFDATGNTNCSGTPKTCAPLWTASVNGGVSSSIAVLNGIAYVASNGLGGMPGNDLAAFDATGSTNCSGSPKTCSPLWTYDTGAIATSPAVSNGEVYVGTESSQVYGFDAAGTTNCSGTPKTCAPLWTASVNSNEGVGTSPAVAYTSVYVGDGCDAENPPFPENCMNGSHFSAFNATTGALQWTALSDADGVYSSPGVANGVVYVGSDDGNLYAFDASGQTDCSGTPTFCSPLWQATIGGTVESSPAIANGMVYVASEAGVLYAYGLP
jgi:outer membrane protein assembly factor BamB